MKRIWIFLSNPFLSAANRSFIKALRISTFHDSALLKVSATEPLALTLYNLYHPKHLALKTAYDKWVSQGGIQQGATLNLKQLLDLLSATKIRQWDIAIQGVYEQNSPEYKALLPNRRTPFQHGSQETIIAAVDALKEAIGTDAALQSLKTTINTFLTSLNDALTAQKGNISDKGIDSKQIEAAILDAMTQMMSNYGALVQNAPEDLETIGNAFDVNSIQTRGQVHYAHIVKAAHIYTICKHTFVADDELELQNNGTVDLQVYLALRKGDAPALNAGFTLTAGDIVTVPASQLGDVATNHFLCVQNTDATADGDIEVELL